MGEKTTMFCATNDGKTGTTATTDTALSSLVVMAVRRYTVWLYEPLRLAVFSRNVRPTALHIPRVKATFVNGFGAAELSQLSVGAAELRDLEGMQAKKGGGGVEEGCE